MATKIPLVALEVGTSRTVAMLGLQSPKTGAPIEIAGLALARTSGIRKSEVVSPQSVTTTVSSVLRELSRIGGVDIHQLTLVYSGGDLQGMPIVGRAEIDASEGEVSEEDLANAIANMRDAPLPSGRTTMEELKCHYVLDQRRIVEDPLSLTASELSVQGIRTHVDSNSLKTLIDAVEDSDTTVTTTLSSAASSPLGCTTPEQRQHGVLVINLGGGTTSWCVMKQDKIAAVGHLAIGGDHVTNDILCAFHAGKDESAQELKHTVAQAILEGDDPTQQVPIPKMLGITKKIKVRALNMVVNARLDELFQIIREDVRAANGLEGLGAGIVLCGGGALLQKTPELVSRVFHNIPCTVGSLPFVNVPEIDEDPEKIRFAALYGALLRAAQIQQDAPSPESGGLRFLNWFNRNGGRDA